MYLKLGTVPHYLMLVIGGTSVIRPSCEKLLNLIRNPYSLSPPRVHIVFVVLF